MPWKTLQTKTEFESPYVTVQKNAVELPDGLQIDDFYTVTVPDAAMIVALTVSNEVLLKKEFRYSCGEDMIECPAGTFEVDETDPLAVAKRELLEETGYTSEDWTYLGETRESTAKLTNKMHIFMAQNCVRVGEQHLDKTEHLDLLVVPLERAVEMVMKNGIRCNSSAHAILRAARIIGV